MRLTGCGACLRLGSYLVVVVRDGFISFVVESLSCGLTPCGRVKVCALQDEFGSRVNFCFPCYVLDKNAGGGGWS